MAYLSTTDDEEQQKQGASSGFSAFGGDTSGQDQGQSSVASGGAAGGSTNPFSAWMGGKSQDQSQGQAPSDQAAADSAKGYQQTYAGDDNKDAKGDAQQGGGSSGFANAPMQAGLSGSGQGTGFINFQNYQDNATSEAPTIAAAGQKLISGEGGNLATAEQPVISGIGFNNNQADSLPFDNQNALDPHTGAPAVQGQTGADSYVGGILNPSDGTGVASSGGLAGLSTWMNAGQPGYAGAMPDKVDYTPGADYTKWIPALTQTPVEGGQTNPSANDYVARDAIASGKYSQGDQMLDTTLLSADPVAQKAIADNVTANTALHGRVADIPGLETQATDANGRVITDAGMITIGVGDEGSRLKGVAADATAAANANPTPGSVANETAAVKAYNDWYGGGGYQHGGIWTPTGTGQGQTAAAPVSVQIATAADNAWRLQHPGDADPSHLPYPDPTNTGNAPQAATWGGSGTQGAPAITSMSQTDPGMSGNPSTGSNVTEPTYFKYTDVINDKSGGKYTFPNLTPSESAVLVTLHPETAGQHPVPTQADYHAAAYQLQNMIALTQSTSGDPKIKANQIATFTKALNAINGKMSSTTPTQSPYDYGKSLGMTDQQMAGMGILPADHGVVFRKPGPGGR